MAGTACAVLLGRRLCRPPPACSRLASAHPCPCPCPLRDTAVPTGRLPAPAPSPLCTRCLKPFPSPVPAPPPSAPCRCACSRLGGCPTATPASTPPPWQPTAPSYPQRVRGAGEAGQRVVGCELARAVLHPTRWAGAPAVEQAAGGRSLAHLPALPINEGVRALWTGLGPNVARNAIINAAELASYDQIKESLIK